MIQRRVLIVEDDPMTRGLLSQTLSNAGFTTQTASNAAEARAIFASFDPDGLLLDIDLGIGPTGLDIADALTRGRPDLAVLFLSHLPDARFAGRSLSNVPQGAGYLHKDRLSEPGVLIDALDALLRGQEPPVRDDLDPRRRFSKLSQTQLEVMRMVAAGLSNQQIADQRGTSVRAVSEVIARSLEALGIDESAEGHSRVLAVREFLRMGSTAREST